MVLVIIGMCILPVHSISFIALIPRHLQHPKHMHYNLYVSDEFDQEEVNIINEATLEWEEKTHGMLVYHIYYNFDTNNWASVKGAHSIIVEKISKYQRRTRLIDREVSKEDHWSSTIVGLYDPRYSVPRIFLVYDRMLGREYFRGTMLHEMSHSLGLEHSEQEDTLMYPGMDHSARHITIVDLQEFCKIWHCDVNKL